MKIYPKDAHVQLVYECPSCRCEWLQTPKQVIKLKGMVCDNCNTYVEFEPFSGVRVIPMYSPKATSARPIEKKPEINNIQKDAIDSLVFVGVKSKDASSYVLSVSFDTVEEYLYNFFKK